MNQALLLGGQMDAIIVFAMMGVFGIFILGLAVMMMIYGQPWLQAYLSGTGISFLQIIAMSRRGTNVKQIVSQGIAASQAGFPIKWNELESAYLQGVDIEKVVTAYIVSSKKGDGFTFEDVVNAARESRLHEMLDR